MVAYYNRVTAAFMTSITFHENQRGQLPRILFLLSTYPTCRHGDHWPGLDDHRQDCHAKQPDGSPDDCLLGDGECPAGALFDTSLMHALLSYVEDETSPKVGLISTSARASTSLHAKHAVTTASVGSLGECANAIHTGSASPLLKSNQKRLQ